MYLSSHQQVDNLFVDRPECAKYAPYIKHEASVKNISPELVARIMIVESNCKSKAVNRMSKDYGLMQINTIHKVSKECLFDARCNIRSGIEILATFKRSSQYSPCMYNIGYAIDKKRKACDTYLNKLKRLK